MQSKFYSLNFKGTREICRSNSYVTAVIPLAKSRHCNTLQLQGAQREEDVLGSTSGVQSMSTGTRTTVNHNYQDLREAQ